MNHMLQLNPSIPVVIANDGKTFSGEAIGWFDYGKEDDLLWLVALDDGGECWLVNNKFIRLHENISIGRFRKKNPESDHIKAMKDIAKEDK